MTLQLISSTTKSTPEQNVDQTRLAQLWQCFPEYVNIPRDVVRIILEYQVPTAMPTLACWSWKCASAGDETMGASIQRNGETDSVLAYHKSATAKDTISVHEGFSNSRTLTVEDSPLRPEVYDRVYLGMQGDRYVVKCSKDNNTCLESLKYCSSKQVLEKDLSKWSVLYVGSGSMFSVDTITGMLIMTSYPHDNPQILPPMFKNIPGVNEHVPLVDLAAYNNDTDTFLVGTRDKIYSVNLRPPYETTEKYAGAVGSATISPDRSTLFVTQYKQIQLFWLPEVRPCGTYPLNFFPRRISASRSTLGVLSQSNEYSVWDTSYGISLYQFSPELNGQEYATTCEQGEWAALLTTCMNNNYHNYLYDTRTPSTKPVLKTTAK